MQHRNPHHSLNNALRHALTVGLSGVPNVVATERLGTTTGGMRRRRPTLQELDVVMFNQVWKTGEMGFSQPANSAAVDGEVVAITGPQKDICVYFGGQLGYRINRPNRRFFLDLVARNLASLAMRSKYESHHGEDLLDPTDSGIDMLLSQLYGAAKATAARHAVAIADMLRTHENRFRRLSQSGG